jgi:hypothetical protein
LAKDISVEAGLTEKLTSLSDRQERSPKLLNFASSDLVLGSESGGPPKSSERATPPTTIQIRLLLCAGSWIPSLRSGSNRRSAKINAPDNVPKIPAELPNFIAVSNMTERKMSGTAAFSEVFLKTITKAPAVAAQRATPIKAESQCGIRLEVLENMSR